MMTGRVMVHGGGSIRRVQIGRDAPPEQRDFRPYAQVTPDELLGKWLAEAVAG